MTCPHCGAEAPPGNRFCPRCRRRLEPAPGGSAALPRAPRPPFARGPGRPVSIGAFRRPTVVTLLGVLNLVGGSLALLAGVGLGAFSLRRPPSDGGIGLVALFALYAVVGILQLATGIGLLRLQSWGRHLQIGLAVVGLLGIPCGTVISILVLIYMMKPEVRTLFSGIPPRQLPPAEVVRVQALSQSSAGTVAAIIAVAAVGLVFVVGIVAAIAIPSLLRARVAANEAAALGDLRTVVSAQAAYSSANAGFSDELECLARPQQCIPGYPDAAPVFLDETFLASRRHGYHFRLVPGPRAPAEVLQQGRVSPSSLGGWAYVAVPLQPGQTGVRAFCAEPSGLVCFTPSGQLSETPAGGCPADCTPF